jgi:hypothetical protein
MVRTGIMNRMICLVLFVVVAVDAIACPACKDSFTKHGSNASVGDAYSLSVVVMLSVPIAILTIGIVMIARRLRQHPNSAV